MRPFKVRERKKYHRYSRLTNYSKGRGLGLFEKFGSADFTFADLVNFYPNYKEQSLRTLLSRLDKQGLLKKKEKHWQLTEGAKSILRHLFRKEKKKILTSAPPSIKNMIIIFDIPETARYMRDWLRSELVAADFIPIQKSVWFGPAPISKELIQEFSERNLLKYLKFFKATKAEIAEI